MKSCQPGCRKPLSTEKKPPSLRGLSLAYAKADFAFEQMAMACLSIRCGQGGAEASNAGAVICSTMKERE
jgi:hypothetical protein